MCRKGTKRKTEPKAVIKKTKKAKGKDPNAPKRPASGFFIFMYVISGLFVSGMPFFASCRIELCYARYFNSTAKIDCVTYPTALPSESYFCLPIFCRETFRKEYKDANPDAKGVAVVSDILYL
jgi:hypothetical protein